jgi:hypothetical protein
MKMQMQYNMCTLLLKKNFYGISNSLKNKRTERKKIMQITFT